MRQSNVAWFCLRSQQKREHIATAHLRQVENIEVFIPRIRFKRKTRHGLVSVTEAMFPAYLFARFNWTLSLRQIYHLPGVSGVVHFGSRWPVIPDETIDDLRASVGTNEIHVISSDLSPGDPVEIVGGSFDGLRAVVSRVMPSAQRVAILMDFLGRQTSIELAAGLLIKEKDGRF